MRSPAILTEGDDARYYLLAESLREGRYVQLWEVGEPSHRDYPPVYPAVLAAWGAIHGDNYDLLLLLNIAASMAGLALLFVMLKGFGHGSVGLLSLLVLAVNPELVSIAGLLRPESLFMLLSLLALALAARSPSERKDRTLGGAAGIAAALTRPLGVVLLPAIGLHWLQERRFRAVAWLALSSPVTVGAWLYYSLLAGGEEGAGVYASDLRLGVEAGEEIHAQGLFARVLSHVPEYIAGAVPQNLALPFVPGTVLDNLIIGGGVAMLGLAGLFVLYRRWRPAVYYLLLYGLILAVWPWYSGRFIVPLLPLVVASVLLGAYVVAGRLSSRLGPIVATTVALSLSGFGLASSAELAARADRCQRGPALPDPTCLDADSRSFFDAVAFVNRELPRDAVLFSGRPATLYLYTGRKTVDRERALRLVKQDSLGLDRPAATGLTHMLLGHVKNLEPRMAVALQPHCEDLTLLGEFGPRTLVLALAPTGEGIGIGREKRPGNEVMPEVASAERSCRALGRYLAATTDPATGEPRMGFRRSWPPPLD